MDCAVGTGNQGCNGGNVEITYRWMLANNAKLMTEAIYPYTARQSSCRYSRASGVQGIGYAYPSLPVWSQLKAQMVRFSRFFIPPPPNSNLVNVRAGSESDLLAKAAIAPVTVAIDGLRRSFMFYSGGYYYEPTCSTTNLNHAVLVVGWGTDATHGDYWLAKNQWGS